MTPVFNANKLHKSMLTKTKRRVLKAAPVNVQLLKLNMLMLLVTTKAKSLLKQAQHIKASILLEEVLALRGNL